MTVTGRGRYAALFFIKAAHSAIFFVMLGAIGWLLATGISGRRDRTTAAAAGLVAVEAAVFLANDGVCPLTPLAERHGADAGRGGVSDIYLPDALARTTPLWSTSLIAIAALLHVRGILPGRRAGAALGLPAKDRDAARRGARRAPAQ